MKTTMLQADIVKQSDTDFLPLQGTDYVEFYVGNAKQAAHFYKTAFGFQSLAYAGPETGVKDKASYAVKVLALRVDNATDAWNQTTLRGARSYMEPQTLKDDEGEVVLSGIHTY